MLVYLALTLALPSTFNLIPRPVSLTPGPGVFRVSPGTPILGGSEARQVAGLFRDELKADTGLSLHAAPGSLGIQFRIDQRNSSLGAEGYRLRVRASGILISAQTPVGLFYGAQTLRQLISNSRAVPGLDIEDYPRYKWRGAHIDVARHFMPLGWLRKFVDVIAFHKLNVLHLHLTDDQGWRMEIKRYPKLTDVGSHRSDTQTDDNPDRFEGRPHSGFYTQAELKSLVAYARERNVTVLPEIEMPGHSQAAIASYPELGNTGRQLPVATGWGTHVDVLNVNDSTIRFYEHVLDEVMSVFPSTYIHIGGDEAPKAQWRASPQAQARIKALGLKDEDQLQGWFIRQIGAFLSKHGRRLIGWDEILEGGLAPGAAVMSWRGEEGGTAAAAAGHDVVMAPSSWTYLDQAETKNPKLELPRSWGNLSLERIYRYQPTPARLDKGGQKRILGAETALWTEAIPTPAVAETMLFPRLCAFAEVVWSPAASDGYLEFRERLVIHMKRLDTMGVHHHPIDPIEPKRIGGWDSHSVETGFSALLWDVSSEVSGAGTYECKLQYFGGDDRVIVACVELLHDGVVVASDAHQGITGARDELNIYRLTVSNAPRTGAYVIRATMRADGGTDSFGDVRFYRVRTGS